MVSFPQKQVYYKKQRTYVVRAAGFILWTGGIVMGTSGTVTDGWMVRQTDHRKSYEVRTYVSKQVIFGLDCFGSSRRDIFHALLLVDFHHDEFSNDDDATTTIIAFPSPC